MILLFRQQKTNRARAHHIDASPCGLSAILSQHTARQEDRKIVAFESRSLAMYLRWSRDTYSQTEKEALAIVWAVEHLHLYLYGGHFTLLTDCKPVELISIIQSQNCLLELKDGIRVYKSMIFQLFTQKEPTILLISCHDIPVKTRQNTRKRLPRDMSTSALLMQ